MTDHNAPICGFDADADERLDMTSYLLDCQPLSLAGVLRVTRTGIKFEGLFTPHGINVAGAQYPHAFEFSFWAPATKLYVRGPAHWSVKLLNETALRKQFKQIARQDWYNCATTPGFDNLCDDDGVERISDRNVIRAKMIDWLRNMNDRWPV